MLGHQFLFKPGKWLGEGTIDLNMVKDELAFVTRWSVGYLDDYGTIESAQQIQVKGLSENMNNQFLLSDIGGGQFNIELENQSMGKVVGKGLVTDKTIAWEFRLSELGFEGMELYQLQNDGSYKMHAEYTTDEEYRTVIDGHIWKQVEDET